MSLPTTPLPAFDGPGAVAAFGWFCKIGVGLAVLAVCLDYWISRKDEPPHVKRMREEGERRLRGGR